MVIYLVLVLPLKSSNLPYRRLRAATFYPCLFCSEWGLHVTFSRLKVGSLLHCLSTLTNMAVYFCCTILEVTFTGRYPAFCSTEHGLSSCLSTQPSGLLITNLIILQNPQNFYNISILSVKDEKFFMISASSKSFLISSSMILTKALSLLLWSCIIKLIFEFLNACTSW